MEAQEWELRRKAGCRDGQRASGINGWNSLINTRQMTPRRSLGAVARPILAPSFDGSFPL